MKREDISIVKQNEKEILEGLAIAIYDVPNALRSKDTLFPLLRIAMNGDKRSELLEVLFNEEPDEENFNRMRVVGIVKFFSPEGTSALLQKVPTKGEVDGLELRAGELHCGPYRLNIEGCSPKNPDGSLLLDARSSYAHEEGRKTEEDKELHVKSNPVRRVEGSRDRSPERVKEGVALSTSGASRTSTPLPMEKDSNHSNTATSSSTSEVVLLEMLLLYCHNVHHSEKKSFPVQPYVVTQILRDRIIPRAIAMLPVKQTERPPHFEVSRALLEVSKEDAKLLMQFFHSIVVELATPYSKRNLETEARFRLFVKRPSEWENEALLHRRTDLLASAVYEPSTHVLPNMSFERVWFLDPISEAHQSKRSASSFSHEEESQRSAPRPKKDVPDSEEEIQSQQKAMRPPDSVSTTQTQEEIRQDAPHLSTSPMVISKPPPIKYREIYSEKYQRVYYAYTCPETGEEKSSWTLPD